MRRIPVHVKHCGKNGKFLCWPSSGVAKEDIAIAFCILAKINDEEEEV